MPELPEVETIRRSLIEHVVNKEIGLVCYNTGSKFEGAKGATGRKVLNLRRRGKFLIFDLGAEEMVISLGMTGKLVHVVTPKDKPHVHVAFGFVDYKENTNYELYYVDARRFGSIKIVPKGEYTGILSELGPEPNTLGFIYSHVRDFLKNNHKNLKTILLEQKLVAGIGNYLADEILFEAGLNPKQLGSDLSRAGAYALYEATEKIISRSIEAGGNSFSDYVNIDGSRGEFAKQLQVYGRDGKECYVCGTIIVRETVAGRSTHYCPKCQPVL